MKCPYCGHNQDRVLDTREQREGEQIRRRRECLQCKSRFSTIEVLSVAYPLIVKKDGRREPFSREKVLRGVQAACQKRPISLAQLEALVEKLSNWLVQRGEKETSSQLIGRKIMSELRGLDDVAYVRFASVYQTFKGVQEFVDILDTNDFKAPAALPSQLSFMPPTSTVSGPDKTSQVERMNHETPGPGNSPSDPLPN
jgi:transcriptional repressor NrdR